MYLIQLKCTQWIIVFCTVKLKKNIVGSAVFSRVILLYLSRRQHQTAFAVVTSAVRAHDKGVALCEYGQVQNYRAHSCRILYHYARGRSMFHEAIPEATEWLKNLDIPLESSSILRPYKVIEEF